MILTHFLAFLSDAVTGLVPALGLRFGGGDGGQVRLKSITSVRDAAISWALEPGETITDSTWNVTPAEAGGLAVVEGSAAAEDTITACQVAGGINRRVYQLIGTITTSRGQVLSEAITWRIGLVETTS